MEKMAEKPSCVERDKEGGVMGLIDEAACAEYNEQRIAEMTKENARLRSDLARMKAAKSFGEEAIEAGNRRADNGD